MEKTKERVRRFGDRYDGFRVKDSDPLFHIIPHIMRSRLDSQVFFEEKIDISDLRRFILEHRAEIPHLSTYHIFVAAAIRTIVQKPRLNRFVSGRKIFSRSYIRASLTVKKSMSKDAEESIVMPEFEASDTLFDVARKLNDEVLDAKHEKSSNDTDIAVKVVNMLPAFVKKFVVWVLRCLDACGIMPKVINRVSPFHSSLFVTNVGSIGLNSVYHHLYEFGTTSMFLAIGKKETISELNSKGEITTKSVINIRLTLDERICDGFYFAMAIKHFKHIMKNPELLLEKPDYISEDY